jgi:hypothetical protein
MDTSATQIRQDLDRELETIRGYADLTEEAKRRRIAEAYEKARPAYERAVEAEEWRIAERVGKSEKAVFATRYPMGTTEAEMASIRAARRSAYNDVYNSVAFSGGPQDTEEALERLLERAERTDDPELADAVYHIATERGSRVVADAYLEKRPAEKKRWDEYVAARQEDENSRAFEGLYGRAMEDRLMKPELTAPGGSN